MSTWGEIARASLGKVVGMLVVTAFALAVIVASVMKGPPPVQRGGDRQEIVLTPVPVQVLTVEPQTLELYATFAGKLEPFERHKISFEIAGRIDKLLVDENDEIYPGKQIATLDTKLLLARRNEAEANLKQAKAELERAERLRARSSGAVTDSELLKRQTAVAVAEAKFEQAKEDLDRASLYSKVSGVVSRKHVNPGEIVSAGQEMFDVVEVDKLLLVVGVPASQIQQVIDWNRRVKERPASEMDGRRPRHKALIRLLERNVIVDAGDEQASTNTAEPESGTTKEVTDNTSDEQAGQTGEDLIMGEVHRISSTADERSGMFEVEILIDNSEGKFRPGQIALAKIVVYEVEGLRLPVEAAQFRDEGLYLYTVEPQIADQRFMFWNVGSDEKPLAREVRVDRYAIQRDEISQQITGRVSDQLIIRASDLPPGRRTVVVRGQHRLVDGRPLIISLQDRQRPPQAKPDRKLTTPEAIPQATKSRPSKSRQSVR